MLVLACSPRPGGATDGLARAVCAGARRADQQPMLVFLRDFAVAACTGCQICASGACKLPSDGADALFSLLNAHASAVFVSPIYFYALPGQFKLFIDRSQKFWAQNHLEFPALTRNAGVVLAAGRLKGEKLFSGSLLTLKWFLKPFGYRIVAELLLRGLDQAAPDFEAARNLGYQLGSLAGKV